MRHEFKIYNYDDYRELLMNWFWTNKEKNSKFSFFGHFFAIIVKFGKLSITQKWFAVPIWEDDTNCTWIETFEIFQKANIFPRKMVKK